MQLRLKQQIVESYEALALSVVKTPIHTCSQIDCTFGGRAYLKAEIFQKTGSFKVRGATNAVREALKRNTAISSFCTHSSGNFGAALAWASRQVNKQCYIVVPENALPNKVAAIRSYNGNIIFCGNQIEDREFMIEQVIAAHGSSFVHPYDDDDIILGQATLAYEFLSESMPLDYLLVPVGGGGLLAGCALAAHYYFPRTKVIGVEPINVNDAQISLKTGIRQSVTNGSTIADGLRTCLGVRNFTIIKDRVHDIICVQESTIIAALNLLWQRAKLPVEPSGAVALAGCLEYPDYFKTKSVGLVLSGGNHNESYAA